MQWIFGGIDRDKEFRNPNKDAGRYDWAAGVGAGGAAAASVTPELTRSFNSLLGLKNGIFLAGTSTRSPVLGLRPTRGLRWRVRKLPKPRISILSPTRSERTMLSKMVSTMTSLSLRVSSARRDTSSIKSALVMCFPLPFTRAALPLSILRTGCWPHQPKPKFSRAPCFQDSASWGGPPVNSIIYSQSGIYSQSRQLQIESVYLLGALVTHEQGG